MAGHAYEHGGLLLAYIRVNDQFIPGLKARGFLTFISKLPAPKGAGVCCQGWKFTQVAMHLIYQS